MSHFERSLLLSLCLLMLDTPLKSGYAESWGIWRDNGVPSPREREAFEGAQPKLPEYCYFGGGRNYPERRAGENFFKHGEDLTPPCGTLEVYHRWRITWGEIVRFEKSGS